MAGKKLQFMGYLPVKAGDWVFTDGRFIFGNVPPKGSPATFGGDSAGIPVLGNNLRGYFSRNGNFKNYSVKQDAWIVNSDKKFAHGSEDNIIDAEFADDGSLLTVEKNPGQSYEYEETDPTTIFYNYWRDSLVTSYQNWITYYSMRRLPATVTGKDADFKKVSSWIMSEKNGFPPFDYIRDTEATQDEPIKDCEIVIKKDGKEIDFVFLSQIVQPAEDLAWKYIYIDIPYSTKDSCIKSKAILKNFKIMLDASWEALFLIEIGTEHLYFDETAEFEIGYEYRCVSLSSTAVHSLFLFKVNSDGNAQKLAEYSEFFPLFHRHNYTIQRGRNSRPPKTDATTFPFIDWGSTNNVFGLDPNTGTITILHSDWIYATIYDSRLMPGAPDYDNPKIEFVDSFSFPVQDNFQAHFTNAEEDIDKWTLDGIFDADNKEIIGAFLPNETDAHTWNMACASLKGGSYLFGIHNKALYKFDGDANFSLVGDNLKNFRLRELKNISKSRR